MHLLATNITKLPLYRPLLGPAVSYGILDDRSGNTDTGVGCGLQTFIVNKKITNFAVETIVEKFPVEKVEAVMAVDGSGTVKRLLSEGVSVIIYDLLLYIPHGDISSS